jgi:hypothetical protein
MELNLIAIAAIPIFNRDVSTNSSTGVSPCVRVKKNPAKAGFRAEDRARTGHPDLGKVVLYQMSYFRL